MFAYVMMIESGKRSGRLRGLAKPGWYLLRVQGQAKETAGAKDGSQAAAMLPGGQP